MTSGSSIGGEPKLNGRAYPIEDHTYDIVVVGAGGAGLRASSAAAKRDCGPPASPKSFPHVRIR